MSYRPCDVVGLCRMLALVALALLVLAPGPLHAQDARCWGEKEAEALGLCQSAWDQSNAFASCSSATVSADMTNCDCSVSATCTKNDGTTAAASLTTNNPDDFNGAVNCNGVLKTWNC